jgi:hypothetical protein
MNRGDDSMSVSNIFVTSKHNQGFFKLPPEKAAVNKYLKKNNQESSLSEKVLKKVFSSNKDENKNQENHQKPK